MIEIPEYVIEHAPWSISKVGVADKCGLYYDFKYVQKIRVDDSTSATRVGSAAHAILEHMLKGAESIRHCHNKAVQEFSLTTNEQEELGALQDAIESFLRRFDRFRKKKGVKDLLIEERWAITRDFKPTAFFSDDAFMRGVVDVGAITESGTLAIIDHKTGKTQEMQYHLPQFNTYEVMGLSIFPDITGAQSAVHYVKTEEIQWGKRHSAEEIRKNLYPWLIDYLARRTMKVSSVPSPTTGWWCNWCPYIEFCPSHLQPPTTGEVNSNGEEENTP